jgi:hypothetical protein
MLLNGSSSSDPEGGALTYVWYDGSTKIADCPNLVVCDTTLSGRGTHSLSLTVLDSAGLSGSAPAQAVSVP